MAIAHAFRYDPAQAVDVITSDGCGHVTPKQSMALARDQPEDMGVLDWTVCHSSFSAGAWHILAAEPALEQASELTMAMA